MGDFDFYVGTWDVANRRRVDYLDPTSPWEEFPAVSMATRHFDGGANIDEISFPTKGWAGLTVRLQTLSPTSGRSTGSAEPPQSSRRR